jgi:hypothetical protein
VSTSGNKNRSAGSFIARAIIWFSIFLFHSFDRILATYAVTLTASILLFKYFESFSWLDCFYWAATTISTVGYGDVTPVTAPGKFTAVGLMIFGGIYLNTIFVTKLVTQAVRDLNQFTHAEQEWLIDHFIRIMQHWKIKFTQPPSDTEHGDVTDSHR